MVAWSPAAASAGPEAHLLGVDPRAQQTPEGVVVTTLLEVTVPRRVSEVTAPCAGRAGDAHLDCIADRLESAGALWAPAPWPAEAATLSVTIDGADVPGKTIGVSRWGEVQTRPGVGTAWIVALDASSSMGPRYDEAKAIAAAFVDSLRPGDRVDVVAFGDGIVADSRWLRDKAQARAFLDGLGRTFPARGRTRPLANILAGAASGALRDLDPAGPVHQAMVVLSNGAAGLDAGSTPAGALELRSRLTEGRWSRDNRVAPRRPVPVISVWLAGRQVDELGAGSREFMEDLANTEIGGFFDVVRDGQAARAPRIVTAVRDRFDRMLVVRWRVPRLAATLDQTLKVTFPGVEPPVVGDTWSNVPLSTDPGPTGVRVEAPARTTWTTWAAVGAALTLAAAMAVAVARRRPKQRRTG